MAESSTRLGGYTLLKRLGRGGMAEVWFATHDGAAGFQRAVVVKRMLSVFARDDAFVRMFVNEAKVAARLMHPNIVQVHELGESDGELFIAMEFIHGPDLGSLLRTHVERRGRAPSPEMAAWIVREASRGLGHAHRQMLADGTPTPIVHRDVSPHNIMVGFDGSVKIVDFGIAKPELEIGEETRTGELKGKVAYMSPEQLAKQRPGPATDQWALGVVLYELLTGRRLFKADTEWETAMRVETAKVPPPSTVNAAVPPALDAIVMRCLERDARARFADMAALQLALDEWLRARFGTERLVAELQTLYQKDERVMPEMSASPWQRALDGGPAVTPGAAPSPRRSTPPWLALVGLSAAALAVVVLMGLFGRWLRGLGQSEAIARPARAVPAATPTSAATAATAATAAAPPAATIPAEMVPGLVAADEEPAPKPAAATTPKPHAATRAASRPHGTKRSLPVFEDVHVRAVDE